MKDLKKNDIKFNMNTIINPDDQIYFFHKNIALKAFSSLSIETYLEYCKKYNQMNVKPLWISEWMLRLDYWTHNKNAEREGHHQFIWNSREIFINPISINVSFRSFHSTAYLFILENIFLLEKVE